jgi:hypothetical protein
MIYPYSSAISADPQTGDFLVMHRPEIPIRISGPKGSVTLVGLVVTGAEFTLFPESITNQLGIELQPSASRVTEFMPLL